MSARQHYAPALSFSLIGLCLLLLLLVALELVVTLFSWPRARDWLVLSSSFKGWGVSLVYVCVCFWGNFTRPKCTTLLLLRYSDILLSWLESLSFYFFINFTSLDFDISHLVIWYERFKVNIIKGCCWCVRDFYSENLF